MSEEGKIRRTEFAAFFSLPCSLTHLLVFIIIMVSYWEAWEGGKEGEVPRDITKMKATNGYSILTSIMRIIRPTFSNNNNNTI